MKTIHKLKRQKTWPIFTWSFGCTGILEPFVPPMISMQRLEITSLTFMLVWVPDPVCQITKGNCESCNPLITCNRRSIKQISQGSNPIKCAVNLYCKINFKSIFLYILDIYNIIFEYIKFLYYFSEFYK